MHYEVLTPPLRSVLRLVAPTATERGFYLAGGTALALHLGHRRSEDAGWFTPAGIREPLALAGALRQIAPDFTLVASAPDTLHGTVAGVRTTWLGYRYGMLAPVVRDPDSGADIAALADIAAMKLAAVAQRGARKDFADVHALCSRYLPLGDLLALYRAKYSVADLTHVLAGLVYFDDAEREPPMQGLRVSEWRAVKADLSRWVKETAR